MSKESEQAAVAEKLGLSAMLPLLRRGADDIEDLRAKAHELGLVMDESLVKTGADATEQMDTISQVIKVQMSEAFVGLSEEIVGFTQHIADALRGLNNFIDRFNEWKRNAQRTGDYPNEFEQNAMKFGPVGIFVAAANNNRRRWNRWLGRSPAAVPPLPTFEEKQFGNDDPDIRLEDTSTRRGGGSSRTNRDAERLARERERSLDQLDREGQRAERDAVRARNAGDTADDRLRLAQETARLQREERDATRETLEAELKRTGAMDAATQAAFDTLKALHAEADTLSDRAMLEEHRKDLAAEALRIDQAREGDALALLDIEAQLAGTRDEQYRIERRILILRQAAERRARQAELDEDKSLSPEERRARMGSLDYRNRLELDLFDKGERDRQRSEFKSFGYDIADAIKEKRVGQHIAEEMQQRLLDMALDGLFDFLNPRSNGGASGGGGFLGMAGSFLGSMFGLGPGRAGGGGLMNGLRHPVVETGRPELLMLGADGHVTSAAETRRLLLDMMQDGSGANGGRSVIEQHFHNDFKGAVMTEDLLKSMDAKAQQAAAAAEGRAVRTSVEISRRGVQARQQSLHRLGT